MNIESNFVVLGAIAAAVLVFFLKNVNWYLYEYRLGAKRYSLPPGDLGWPIIGNMFSFLKAFRSGGHPDSFIDNYYSRFGKTGIYKAFMFGSPTVIVTTPDACRKVLTDNDHFVLGWPSSTAELMGEKSFIAISFEEHKRLKRLTSASINGLDALSLYLVYIEETVKTSLDKWSKWDNLSF